jgi:hypothetical protein
MGEWMLDPRILELVISWRWVVRFMPRPHYPRGKGVRYLWIRCLVDPRTGLDNSEKRKFLTLPWLELQPLNRPACSQSLYRLRYSSSVRRGEEENLAHTGTRTPTPRPSCSYPAAIPHIYVGCKRLKSDGRKLCVFSENHRWIYEVLERSSTFVYLSRNPQCLRKKKGHFGDEMCASILSVASFRNIFRPDRYLRNYTRGEPRRAPRPSCEVSVIIVRLHPKFGSVSADFSNIPQRCVSWKSIHRLLRAHETELVKLMDAHFFFFVTAVSQNRFSSSFGARWHSQSIR